MFYDHSLPINSGLSLLLIIRFATHKLYSAGNRLRLFLVLGMYVTAALNLLLADTELCKSVLITGL